MELPAFSGRKKSINLLPKDAFEVSGIGVILSWALAFGKWAVILTQLVVMSAFLWRFTLDREVTDLRRKIQTQNGIIAAYGEIEDQFTLTQKRLQFAKPVIANQTNTAQLVALLHTITPADVWYDTISFTKDSVTLGAYSTTLAGFSTFLGNLQGRPEFSSVSVGKIEDGGESGAQLQFDITLSIKASKS